MALAALIDKARAVQRELADERRAGRRSPAVPFVPKPQPLGWDHDALAAEIEAEMAALAGNYDRLLDALEQQRWHRLAQWRERWRFLDGLSKKRRNERQNERRKQTGRKAWPFDARTRALRRAYLKDWRALRKDAAICRDCPNRVPQGKARCQDCVKAANAAKRRRRTQGGRCTYCKEPPTHGKMCQKHHSATLEASRKWKAKRAADPARMAELNAHRRREYARKKAVR